MKPYREQSYYELLEVPTSATAEEIRAAYERAVRLYDADSVALYPVGDSGQVEELKKLLGEAVETLTDPELRLEYDRAMAGAAEAAPIAAVVPISSARGAGAGGSGGGGGGARAVTAEKRAPDPEPDPEPAPRPTQLSMNEILSGAETVHSTVPRYSVSYVERPTEVVHHPAPAAFSPSERRAGEPGDWTGPAPRPDAPAASVEPAAGEGGAAAPPRPSQARPGQPANAGGRRSLDSAPILAEQSALADAESALAQVQAHVAQRSREPRPRPVEVPADAVFNGELLRHVRKSRGMSLQVLAERTRISTRHLENIEADRYDALPATVYVRGFLMSIARELGLDALRVSKGYLALVEKQGGRR